VPSSFESKCARINLFFYCFVLRGEVTSVIRTVGKCYQTARCNITKYLKLQQHRCENCKSSKSLLIGMVTSSVLRTESVRTVSATDEIVSKFRIQMQYGIFR